MGPRAVLYIHALFSSLPVLALDSALTLQQLDHAAHIGEEVPLGVVRGITQTRDGYLWVGTNHGLFRFDGAHFKPIAPGLDGGSLTREISSLYTDSGGSMWIGTPIGVWLYSGGQVSPVTGSGGKPLGSVVRILGDASGNIWAAMSAGNLLRIRRRAYGVPGVDVIPVGLPGIQIRSLFLDRQGGFWIGTQSGICKWDGIQAGPCFATGTPAVSIGEDDTGQLLVGGVNKGILRVGSGHPLVFASRVGKLAILPRLLLTDRDKEVWIGTLGQGLLRWKNGQVERFSRREGLTSDLIESMFEDREGNLWVGTSNGLNRFRNPLVPRYTSLDGLSGEVITAVQASQGGPVWVGTVGAGINRIDKGKIQAFKNYGDLPDSTVTSLYEDRTGTLWVGTTGGVAYWSGSRFLPVRSSEGPIKNVFTMTESGDTLWLVQDHSRLLRIGRNEHFAAYVGQPPSTRGIYRLAESSRGGVWEGFYDGGVARFDGSERESYGAAKGLAKGPVLALREDGSGVLWVGTTNGLSRIVRDHCDTWNMEGGVQGIIDDRRGGNWFVTSTSLLHLRTADLGVHAGGSPIPFGPESLNGRVWLGDGVCATTPRFTLAANGILWMGTDEGLLAFDTLHPPGSSPAPRSVIEQVLVDGKSLDLRRAGGPVFRGTEVQIQYAGLNLSSPEQVEFRYMLRGLETKWWEVGDLRKAVYTNLHQGTYTFCVTARNNGGPWDASGACQSFEIRPAYYQSRVFIGACILAAAGMLFLIHNARIRQMQSRFALVLQERVRIARELHDTLLQGFAGVTYQIEAAYRQIKSHPEASEERLLRTMDLADQSIAQARQAISLLRLSGLEGKQLAEAIAVVGQEFTANTDAKFTNSVYGMTRALPYDVEASVYMAACEAIRNALKHANPKNISSELSLTAKGLRLVILDDGIGFDPKAAPAKAGHFGLRGMRERAAAVGGSVSVSTIPGEGTRVEVTVPVHRLILRGRN